MLFIYGGALRLSCERLKVKWNPEPGEALNDVLLKLWFAALEVSVLKSKDHYAAVMCGIEIVKQRGAHRTNMQKPSRARREACNNLRHRENIAKSRDLANSRA